MYFYGRTPHAAPLTHRTAARTKSLPTPTKYLRLSCVAGRSLCQQNVSSLDTYWKGPSTTSLPTPAAHQRNLTATSQSSHIIDPGSADYTLQSSWTLPDSLKHLSHLLYMGVMWEHRTWPETALYTRQLHLPLSAQYTTSFMEPSNSLLQRRGTRNCNLLQHTISLTNQLVVVQLTTPTSSAE